MREQTLERYAKPARSSSNAENTGFGAIVQRRPAPVIQMKIPEGVKEGTTVYKKNGKEYTIVRQSKSDRDYYYVTRKGKEKKVNRKKLYFSDNLPKKKRDKSDEDSEKPKRARLERKEKEEEQEAPEPEEPEEQEEQEEEIPEKEAEQAFFGPLPPSASATPSSKKAPEPAPKKVYGVSMPPSGFASASSSVSAYKPAADLNSKASAAQYPVIADSMTGRAVQQVIAGLKAGTIKMDKPPHQDQHFTVNKIAPGFHFYLRDETAAVWTVFKVSDGYGNQWS